MNRFTGAPFLIFSTALLEPALCGRIHQYLFHFSMSLPALDAGARLYDAPFPMRLRLYGCLFAGQLLLIFCTATMSDALSVAAPRDGETLHSGSWITVSVRVADAANVRRVRYYWIRVGDESVEPHQADPAEFHPENPKQPLDGMVLVPHDAIGRMRFLAVGEIVRGRLAGHQDFDEVIVDVEPEAKLGAIEFAVAKPWRLDTLGKRLPIPVVGQFEDGVVRPLQGVGTGSVFGSTHDGVVRVNQQGEVLVVGNGKAVITVTNRQQEGRLEVVVEGDQAPNRPPEAVIPSPMAAKPGAVVLLNGLQSRDPDGDPLLFHWRQVRGNRVDLTTPNEAKTSFIAPLVSERRLLQFQLAVTDMSGPDTVKGADSEPAVVDVWVEP